MLEEAFEHSEALSLGGDGDGVAVGFAVAVEVLLEGLEDGSCDLARGDDAALLTPAEEAAVAFVVELDGAG